MNVNGGLKSVGDLCFFVESRCLQSAALVFFLPNDWLPKNIFVIVNELYLNGSSAKSRFVFLQAAFSRLF